MTVLIRFCNSFVTFFVKHFCVIYQNLTFAGEPFYANLTNGGKTFNLNLTNHGVIFNKDLTRPARYLT